VGGGPAFIVKQQPECKALIFGHCAHSNIAAYDKQEALHLMPGLGLLVRAPEPHLVAVHDDCRLVEVTRLRV
jgi:hypothetical protein